MTDKQIHEVNMQMGNTKVHVAGRGEDFKKGMEKLANDLQEKHWFKCKKCSFEFQDDSHCSNHKKCPKCGNPQGMTRGCFGTCSLIHGIWEGIEGVCKCKDAVALISAEEFAKKYIKKSKEAFFWKWLRKVYPEKRECFKCNKITDWRAVFSGTDAYPFCKVCGSNLGRNVGKVEKAKKRNMD